MKGNFDESLVFGEVGAVLYLFNNSRAYVLVSTFFLNIDSMAVLFLILFSILSLSNTMWEGSIVQFNTK